MGSRYSARHPWLDLWGNRIYCGCGAVESLGDGTFDGGVRLVGRGNFVSTMVWSEMKISPQMEQFRLKLGEYRSENGQPFGAFECMGPCGARLLIIASDGSDTSWEHVSVSTRRRVPNWIEMAWVKKRFWEAEDCVVQYHPPESKYVNNYDNVLHMWRWRNGAFPQPPSILVGDKRWGSSG